MPINQFFLPYRPAYDAAGISAPGAKLYFTEAGGTNTPKPIYEDEALTIELSNPVIADGAGQFVPIYLADDEYRVRIYGRNATVGVDTPYEEYDPYIPGALAGTVLSNASTVVATRTHLAALTGAANSAVFLGESGREGQFYWSAANNSALVTADPNQGVYVAPVSDATGASGAWVRKFSGRHNVKWFGAVGDDATNDGAAFAAALAYLLAISTSGGTYGYGGKSAPSLFVPAGRYFLSTTSLDFTTAIIFEGEGSGMTGPQSTVLRWAAGQSGIRIQAINTSGETTSGLSLTTAGYGATIRHLALYGGYNGSNDNGTSNTHGINMRAMATVEDVFLDLWQGNGIYIHANAGGNDGNANGFQLNRVVAQRCRNGVYADGPDVNAGTGLNVSAIANRAWGIWDSSFLGNTWIGCHTSDNVSGPYKTDDLTAASVFVGCYSESGQPASSFEQTTTVVGGLHAAGMNTATFGGYLATVGNQLVAAKSLTANGNIFARGANSEFGPTSGATDSTLVLNNTNVFSALAFKRSGATDGQILSISGGMYYDSAVHNYQVGGVTKASLTGGKFNLVTGYAYSVNSLQVVGARDTGWTADTGTAKKTATATYAPGTTLTYSAAYVQAEQTATSTRLQLIEPALRDATQEIKALKDALIAHGLIGT